jgi:hypothetical protein
MHTNVSVVQDTPETNVKVSSVYMILFVRKVMVFIQQIPSSYLVVN